MPFTAQELANISNAALDFNIKGAPMDSAIQEKPLMNALKSKQKEFPGGKEFITTPVKGVHSTTIQGYNHDDQVSYANPANLKRATARWYEIHAGINFTNTELKNDGISVVDSEDGAKTTNHSDRELTSLTNLLEDKLDDLNQGWADSFQSMLWKDGTQDSKVVPGITSIVLDVPTTGSTFGIDRVPNPWFQNRATLGVVSNSGTYVNQPLVQMLQKEFRQLRRYNGLKPTSFFAGSTFMDAFEQELRAKGNYTLEGWSKGGAIDASIADLEFKGISLVYDPTLDDIGRAKYGYVLDLNAIRLMVMSDEDMKTHAPARPEDRYVYYRAVTWTGGLIAKALRSSGVYSVA